MGGGLCLNNEMKKIPLHGANGAGKHVLVDASDFESLNKYKWSLLSTGYACRNESKRGFLLMHREIAGTPKGKATDHINLNKLDNRRSNLRVCTFSDNQHNRGLQKNNTSGYKGVSWNPKRKKWGVKIMNKRQVIRGGHYESIIEAAEKYNELSNNLFGQFSRENTI